MSGIRNERQTNEMLALQAIYGDELKLDDSQVCGSIEIPIELPDEIYLLLPDFSSASSTTNSAKRKVPLKYFPPFNLEFTLPEEYPDDHPPKFQISAFWLSPLYAQKLSSKLAQIYYEIQDVILFHWVEFLRNEAIHFLDLLQDDTLDLVLKIDESGALDLLNTIIQYDRHAQYSVFQNSSFPCGICLSSCRGTHSFQFPSCSHVYCISCLSGYFTNLVSENRLNLVACPDSACMKSANATENLCTLAPETLAPLLSPETLQKLSDLSAKNSLESRKDIVWCPRRECQFPVPPDATDSRLGICPKCSFTFCKLCLRVWHGSHARCQVRNVGRLVREYQEANDFTRTQIERRYGKRALQALIANYQSEEASLSWISKHAIPCPSCGVGVTKSEGCNHMICQRCLTHFCFLCGLWLSPKTPYRHYNESASPCFQKLFTLLEEDEVDIVFEDDGEEGPWGGDHRLGPGGRQLLEGEVPAEHLGWAFGAM